MDSYSLGKDMQALLEQLASINVKLDKKQKGKCSCDSERGIVLSEELASELLKFGDAVESILEEFTKEGDWNVERLQKVTGTVEALRSSKRTYCCKIGQGQDGYYEDCSQFRCYSWQAPLFCIRDARARGYSQGSVGRVECTSPPCP